jgi:hypothetical protein
MLLLHLLWSYGISGWGTRDDTPFVKLCVILNLAVPSHQLMSVLLVNMENMLGFHFSPLIRLPMYPFKSYMLMFGHLRLLVGPDLNTILCLSMILPIMFGLFHCDANRMSSLVCYHFMPMFELNSCFLSFRCKPTTAENSTTKPFVNTSQPMVQFFTFLVHTHPPKMAR